MKVLFVLSFALHVVTLAGAIGLGRALRRERRERIGLGRALVLLGQRLNLYVARLNTLQSMVAEVEERTEKLREQLEGPPSLRCPPLSHRRPS